MAIRELKDGCILRVLVKPYSERFKIFIDGENIIVFVVGAPLKGKVNMELVKELSRLFRRRVRLVSGFSSKEKTLYVEGLRKVEMEAFFRAL